MKIERPESLQCEVIFTPVKINEEIQNWYTFISYNNGRPFEVFIGQLNDFCIPLNLFKNATIIKVKGASENHYNLKIQDKNGYNVIIEDIQNLLENKYKEQIILINKMLRNGLLNEIVDCLGKFCNVWSNMLYNIFLDIYNKQLEDNSPSLVIFHPFFENVIDDK